MSVIFFTNSARWMFSVERRRMNQGCRRKWSKVKPTRSPHRFCRRQFLEMQLALALADFAIGVEQHRRIERLLVAEVVVKQPLVGGRAFRNAVDARAIEAELAEFCRGPKRECRCLVSVGLRWRCRFRAGDGRRVSAYSARLADRPKRASREPARHFAPARC